MDMDGGNLCATRGIDRLIEVMRRLRDPQSGCPWDLEQSFATIAPYTIEEAYEVADAIAREAWGELEGELGDLLLQVVYHARMAEEAGLFDFDRVAHAIADKMVRRHPHVFGEENVASSDAQRARWEETKAAERAAKAGDGERHSVLDDVPLALPALTRAEKLQKRAARVGFDWGAALPILAKIEEEVGELREAMRDPDARDERRAEMGDLLFSVVNLARHLDIDPEEALRQTNRKFERRFRRIEVLLAQRGERPEDVGLEALDGLWNEAKKEVG
jgi:nucleoside triphosphate diphosphatase